VSAGRSQHSVVVVPDGLAYDPVAAHALEQPSFVFRAVLEHVSQCYADQPILVAPANAFGGRAPEHEVGAAWLRRHGCGVVETPPLGTVDRYIDTWGNAVELKRWLAACGRWPLGPVLLVCAFRHAARAALCFRRNGYALAGIDRVRYTIENVPVVPRLFYYRSPWLHRCYEAVALVRDRLRPVRL
jgi:hypothetical protein